MLLHEQLQKIYNFPQKGWLHNEEAGYEQCLCSVFCVCVLRHVRRKKNVRRHGKQGI